MRRGFWIALAVVAFAVGVVSGIMWQAYFPLLKNLPTNRSSKQDISVYVHRGTPMENVRTLFGPPGDYSELSGMFFYRSTSVAEVYLAKDLWDCGTHIRLVMYDMYEPGLPVVSCEYYKKLPNRVD
jgi:hypothetical protein